MKNFRWTLLALLLLAAPQVARAQVSASGPPSASAPSVGSSAAPSAPPASMGEVGGTTTTTTATADTGDITTGGLSGINPNGGTDLEGTMDSTATGDDTGALPNTGGEPVIMTLVGLAIAATAFGLLRKVTA